FFQREIAEAAYRYQRELDKKEKVIVGMNQYVEEGEKIDIPILSISPEVEVLQRKRLADLHQSRNQEAVAKSLAELKQSAADGSNLMPHLLNATRNYVTLGEMCNSLIEHFGIYEEQAVF
ncbi:MAG: methylmalonyl-CoA mutase family protein, partial [Bacteroidota bacterium]